MDAIYHYTNKDNWEQIQRDGLLLPRTLWLGHVTEDGINESRKGHFLVGLERPEDERWKEAGLWDTLIRVIKEPYYTDTYLVLLEVPILSTCGFAREHWHWSPQGFKERYGVNLWGWPTDEELKERGYDRQRANELNAKGYSDYIHSAVPISEYDGSFRVPEFWLQQETPVEKVKVIGGGR